MGKNTEDQQNALGFIFSLANTPSTSLTSYSGAYNHQALTKTEERLIIEAHKRQLILDLMEGLRGSGSQAASRMLTTAGTEFLHLQTNLNAVSEAARGTPFHLMVEAFCQQLTRLGAESQYEIAKTGVAQILSIINASFDMRDVPEEKRSLILRLLGG